MLKWLKKSTRPHGAASPQPAGIAETAQPGAPPPADVAVAAAQVAPATEPETLLVAEEVSVACIEPGPGWDMPNESGRDTPRSTHPVALRPAEPGSPETPGAMPRPTNGFAHGVETLPEEDTSGLGAGVLQRMREASRRFEMVTEASTQKRRPKPKPGSPLGIVIAVGNQKGGVGKTTNTVHIAAALGLRGYKSLIIDLDPAAGATKHLGVDVNHYAGSLELLSGRETLQTVVIQENLPKGVHLVPSRPQLSELDLMLSKFVDRMSVLEGPLAEARKTYDFVLLDTAPVSAATTTVAAYASADWFLLSAFAHPLSLGGLSEAFNDIADVRAHRNGKLEVLGVVFSNVDIRAKNMRARVEAVIDDVMPGRKFQTWIPQACVVPDCSGKGVTLFQLPSYGRIKVAHQFMNLAREIEHRVLNREAFLDGTLAAPQLD
jgi:chromosome partitioning protein